MVTTNDRYDLLESWIFWKRVIENDPKAYRGYEFPGTIHKWYATFDGACPVCNGLKEGPIDDENGKTKNVMCICSILDWLQARDYAIKNYESPMRPAYLEDIVINLDEMKSNFGLAECIDFFKIWMNNPFKWVTLEGANGTGKTHIMRAVKTYFGGISAYISTDQFQQNLFSSLQDKEDGVNKLINFLSTIPILLIDDWGIEHDNSWTTDTLASIVNYRYAFPKYFPTIFSFNHSKEQLDSHMGYAKKRIVSRIYDSQISERFVFGHKDYRDIKTPKTPIKKERKVAYVPGAKGVNNG